MGKPLKISVKVEQKIQMFQRKCSDPRPPFLDPPKQNTSDIPVKVKKIYI